jgi:nucleoside 2-deoxyribosyltransferase
MKIYFAGSIRGGRDDRDLYLSVITHLKQYGEVLSEHIGEENLSSSGETDSDNLFIHRRDMEWLVAADVVVAEVSTPSLGVGYEIGRALENQKPVLCLYRMGSPKKLSAMIAGSPALSVVNYSSSEEAFKAIDAFILNIAS